MSKLNLYNDAEKLFLYDRLSPDEISEKLQISRRTVYYWKNKFNWDKKLSQVLTNRQIFSIELQDFVKLLMKNIIETIENKGPTNQAILYSLVKLLNQMPELQKNENFVQSIIKPKSKETEKQKQAKMSEIVDEVNRMFGLY